ncbi:beta-fructosidase [Phormidium tenue FACHB-1052]|uniref:Beta-fructosidase n=2 Tax=Phormidium tenue TaxID=126344 RepID=A0A1U7J3M7_9CYAN|nr:beta-fructosidase [Phormidium tenue FACHB-1052]OKH46844.1 beta-fructosidase [Phormidium tenue NIES-30]
MQHPSRYVWDFWYHFDPAAKLFHVFYLNADRALVSSEQQHYASCVGHATTPDFVAIDWGDESNFDVLKPPPRHWANTCLWSGDIIKAKNSYLMFYTSRDRRQDDGMTQSIGVAYTSDLFSNRWHFFDTQIKPKFFYQTQGIADDLTIHAWRDPFLFRHRASRQIFMLVSAKALNGPIGRRGVVALLQVADDNFAQAVRGDREWQYFSPLLDPGHYSEMEVPQLYQRAEGSYELVFSCWAKYDFSPVTGGVGGFQGITAPQLWPEEHDDQRQSREGVGSASPRENRSPLPLRSQTIRVLAPETQGLYACRVVPELSGEIIGFDIQTGGIRRSGIQTNLASMDRDFSDLAI